LPIGFSQRRDFSRRANLLLNIDLTSSFDGRVLSLQEKQMNVLRNQNQA
jgi:uncharacterized protein YigA (DUF484 family)